MATLGKVPGKIVKFWRGNEDGPPETFTAIGCLTTNSIALTSTVLEQACKDSGSWAEKAQGDKSGTVTFELILAHDATVGAAEIRADYYAGTNKSWQWGTLVTGDPQYDFEGFVSDYNEDADVGEFALVSVTVQISGQVTESTT